MRLSEKNVLISTGILFVIAFAMLKLGSKESAEELEKLSIEITSASYEVNEGRLHLTFEKPTTASGSIQITIIDENDHSISGRSIEENNSIIFEAYIPDFNYESTLNILIKTNSTENINLQYKIPKDNIFASR